jgi:hypothetical protein
LAVAGGLLTTKEGAATTVANEALIQELTLMKGLLSASKDHDMVVATIEARLNGYNAMLATDPEQAGNLLHRAHAQIRGYMVRQLTPERDKQGRGVVPVLRDGPPTVDFDAIQAEVYIWKSPN